MRADFYETLHRINLNQLVAFVAVAETCSFRGAAARMHLSQSAVSVQVRQLETVLGVPLLNRTTRSVSLTRGGAELLQYARKLCDEITSIAGRFREEAQLQSGLVHLVSLPGAAVTLLPLAMREFREIHPGVEIRLADLDSRAAFAALRSGDADLGILSCPPDADEFAFELLYKDEVVVVSPSLSKGQGARNLSIREVARLPLLVAPEGVQLRTLVDELFAAAGLTPKVAQECFRPQTLLALVEEGFGCAVSTRSALAPLDLSRVLVQSLRPVTTRDIGLVNRRGIQPAPAVVHFRRFLADYVERSAPVASIKASAF